jgi:basic amino acid/polyamine antiporter, APA family
MAGRYRTKSAEQSIADTDEPSTQPHKNLTTRDLVVFGGVGGDRGRHLHGHRIDRGRHHRPGHLGVVSDRGNHVWAGGTVLRRVRLDLAGGGQRVHLFVHATFGELLAWIIGWNLVLELAMGAAVVAKGWSGYLGTVFGFVDGTITLGSFNLDWGRC